MDVPVRSRFGSKIGSKIVDVPVRSATLLHGPRNRRGFTQHEHVDRTNLVHMNGRIFDAELARFYGVDPFIQFPSNSQSLNPYSYILNNPFAGTDPTGYAMTGAGERMWAMARGGSHTMPKLFGSRKSFGNGSQSRSTCVGAMSCYWLGTSSEPTPLLGVSVEFVITDEMREEWRREELQIVMQNLAARQEDDRKWLAFRREQAWIAASFFGSMTPPGALAETVSSIYHAARTGNSTLIATELATEIGSAACGPAKALCKRLGNVTKKVPNPFGKKGGLPHQAKVEEVVQEVEARGLQAVRELRISTPGGKKATRYVDVAGVDPATGQVRELHQVGRQTKGGLPVSRERSACDDIECAAGIRPEFHPYN